MSDEIKEIGLGGALMLAMLIIKDVLAGLLKRRNGNDSHKDTAGDKSPEYWERRFDAIDNSLTALAKDVGNLRGWLADCMTDIKSALSTLIRWKGGD